MPFHAAGGLATWIETSSTPAMQAVFSASRPPMPPEGTKNCAPARAAAASAALSQGVVGERARGEHDHADARIQQRHEVLPHRFVGSGLDHPSAASAASSASRPTTYGTPNSRRERARRGDAGARPATATNLDVREARRGERAPAQGGRWCRRRAARCAWFFSIAV